MEGSCWATVVQRATGVKACGRAGRCQGEECGTTGQRDALGVRAGRRTAMPPQQEGEGGSAGAGPDNGCGGRVSDPPGTGQAEDQSNAPWRT